MGLTLSLTINPNRPIGKRIRPMRRFVLLLSLLLCIHVAAYSQNNPFVGDWTGRWSYSKWDKDNDIFSTASGYTIVRISYSNNEYVVRIKEVEDSSEPQITYYLPDLKTVYADSDIIEIQYRYAEWGIRKIQLRLRDGYLSMSSTMIDEERLVAGRMSPIMIARNNSDGYGMIKLDGMEELRLFNDNNW